MKAAAGKGSVAGIGKSDRNLEQFIDLRDYTGF